MDATAKAMMTILVLLMLQTAAIAKIDRQSFYLDIGNSFPKEGQGGSSLVFKLNFLYHIQGINRFPQTNYLLLSGNTKNSSYLYLGEMGSRSLEHPWESNVECRRTWKGKRCQGNPSDKVIQVYRFEDKFKHIGGVDIADNLAAVALDTKDDQGEIRFFKLDAGKLVPIEHLTIKTPHRNAAVSFKKIDETYFVIAFDIRFLGTKQASAFQLNGDILSESAAFKSFASKELSDDKLPYYQNTNLYPGPDGKLLLDAFYRKRLFKIFPFIGKDIVDTYELSLGTGKSLNLKRIRRQRIRTKHTNFLAGAGSYTNNEGGQTYLSTGYWPIRRTLDGSKVIRFETFYNESK